MSDLLKHPLFLASYTAQGEILVYGRVSEATGVCFTRDPSTGENIFSGEFLVDAQGDHAPERAHETKTKPQGPGSSAEQHDDDPDPELSLELNALESAIFALAQKTQKVADASQRRGDRIDAMLAKIDETIATLTSI